MSASRVAAKPKCVQKKGVILIDKTCTAVVKYTGLIVDAAKLYYEQQFATTIFTGIPPDNHSTSEALAEIKKKRVRKFITISIEIKSTILRVLDISLREIILSIEHRLRELENEDDSIYLSSPNSVILLRSENFRYPTDISFFETIYLTYLQNLQNSNTHFLPAALLEEMHTFFRQRFEQQITQAFRKEIDSRRLLISTQFYDTVAEVFANYVREISVRIFKYSKAFTNQKNTCTINRNVFLLIMDMPSFDNFFTLNRKMCDEISAFTESEKEKATRRNSTRPKPSKS
jgi:hypothetical protein